MSDLRQSLGTSGEQIAATFLHKKGYAIVERNYRCRHGEIDIIAQDGDYLVFVEVKTRKSKKYGTPAAAVDHRKQKQICRVTAFYLQHHSLHDIDLRFDVIAIHITTRSTKKIDHFINAFEYCI